MEKLGDLLRRHRGPLPQREAEERSGLDFGRVSYYETRTSRGTPRPWELLALGAVLSIPVFDLLRSVHWWPAPQRDAQTKASLAGQLLREALRLYELDPAQVRSHGTTVTLTFPTAEDAEEIRRQAAGTRADAAA